MNTPFPKTQLRRPAFRERLAQLMIVRIGSHDPPVRTVEQDFDRLSSLMEKCPIGGLAVFHGSAEHTPGVLADLQATSKYPLLVGADIELGVGQQLRGHTLFPHAMAFDRLGPEAPAAVEAFAELTARLARANGIHVSFSPVADVNNEPRNPIIATRSFGSEPQRVAELVTAFLTGSRRGGVLATAKHFPGHGNTRDDSHHKLPVVDCSKEQLEACELIPFRAAINAGVPLIMTSHVYYPAWDKNVLPATLSRNIVTGLLRNELRYQGAVISDSMLMEGYVSGQSTEGELAVATLNAGVDLLLDVADPVGTLGSLERAVEEGRLSEERVDEAFDAVQRLKAMAFQEPDPQGDAAPPSPSECERLALDVARRAVTVVKRSPGQAGLDADKPLLAVYVKSFSTPSDRPVQPLKAALESSFAGVDYCEVDDQTSACGLDEATSAASEAAQVLVAVVVKPAAWRHFGLPEALQAFVDRLLKHPRCVVASLGFPEWGIPPDSTACHLCTFSDVPVSQEALADALADGFQEG